MKVLGLISSPADPASRVRIIQYEKPFNEVGHILIPKFFTPLKNEDPAPWAYKFKKITGISEWRSTDLIKTIGRTKLLLSQKKFDIIWQNRLLQSQHFFWENKLSKPVIFDFDDAIWLTEGKKQVIQKIEISTMIFAGNSYLADFAYKYNKNVHVIPTTIDTNALYPLQQPPEQFTIGWIGSETNFQYLESIYPSLKNFLLSNKECKLMIVSSRLPDFLTLDKDQLVFRQWEADRENQYINEFSVGIMPLTDSEWTKGKCSYKLLQYLACGIPAIASPGGTNTKILTESKAGLAATTGEEWIKALLKIKNDLTGAHSLGVNGRKFVEEKYSINKWLPIIMNHFKKISG